MEAFERAKEIAEFIKTKINNIPDTAVVLGSGLGAFGESVNREYEINYKDIPNFPVSTVPGHVGKFIFGKTGNKRIIAMQGRFHLYEGYSTDDATLYVRVFSLLGVKNLILTNAAGAINTSFSTGDLMLIEDHFSLFCPNPLIGANEEKFGPRFISMCDAYDKNLIKTAQTVGEKLDIELRVGTYCYTSGPSYETPLEIRALRTLGCDVCGMSTVPEVIVANHCGIKVLGISCITNMAAGIQSGPLSHDEVVKAGISVEDKFKRLINGICEVI